MKTFIIGILAALFTYFVILPIAFPGEISLIKIDHLLGFLFVMILFTFLISKFLFNLLNKGEQINE